MFILFRSLKHYRQVAYSVIVTSVEKKKLLIVLPHLGVVSYQTWRRLYKAIPNNYHVVKLISFLRPPVDCLAISI